VQNTRLTRLVAVGFIMFGLIGLMYLSVDPETQYSVDEVMTSPDDFDNNEVHIRGIVKSDSVNNASQTFILEGTVSELSVAFADIAVPDGFGEGKTIAVKGHLSESSSGWILTANEIQTGCPSKYETE